MPIVTALKHNGETSKIFRNQTLMLERDDLLVFYSDKGTRVDEVRKGTHWISHYAAWKVFPKGDYYNFIIVEKEDGLEYYCNLASPVRVAEEGASYIDYDIDVVLSPVGDVTVYDVQEFHERTVLYGYPAERVSMLLEKQIWLEKELQARQGLFSPDFYRMIKKGVDI